MMLPTVWVFIGIEGASVYSARARRSQDVGRATVAGVLICLLQLLLLMAVSLLSLGIFTQPVLAALKTPSMAAVLEGAVGTRGAALFYVGLIVSVGGSFLAWTLLAFLIAARVSKASYLTLISLSTAMILVPYRFSAASGLALARRGEGVPGAARRGDTPVAALASACCLCLLYAAELKELLLSALHCAPGAALYLLAKRQRVERAFTGLEGAILGGLLVLALLAARLSATGQPSL